MNEPVARLDRVSAGPPTEEQFELVCDVIEILFATAMQEHSVSPEAQRRILDFKAMREARRG